MLNGGGGPSSALILGERLECELLLSWAPKDLHGREPYKWQKNLPQVCNTLLGSGAANRETPAPRMPGFIRSGTHSTAHEISTLEDNKTRLYQPPPALKSSAPTLSYDFTVKLLALQIFCIFWPQTQRVICCFHCEVGPADMGFFQHPIQHQQSSPLTERTVHFSNQKRNSFLIFHLKDAFRHQMIVSCSLIFTAKHQSFCRKEEILSQKDPETVLHPLKRIISKF